jgi:hypothetical protein
MMSEGAVQLVLGNGGMLTGGLVCGSWGIGRRAWDLYIERGTSIYGEGGETGTMMLCLWDVGLCSETLCFNSVFKLFCPRRQ